jgi:hypothetical protein
MVINKVLYYIGFGIAIFGGTSVRRRLGCGACGIPPPLPLPVGVGVGASALPSPRRGSA